MSRLVDLLRSRENGKPPADGVELLAAPDAQTPRLRARRKSTPPGRGGGARGRLRDPLALAGLALVLIALIGYLAIYESGQHRTPVLVAAHTLSAGTVLNASDLRTGSLSGEAPLLATLLPGGELSQILGRRLSTAVAAGAPLPAAALAGSPAKSSALVLSAPAADVSGTRLEPGDRVTVLATFGAGSGTASTKAVARNLEVLAVGQPPAATQASTSTIAVTLALPNASLASSLALADQDAKLDLLLEGAGASTAAIPSVNQRSEAP